jgi:hypothetical protein
MNAHHEIQPYVQADTVVLDNIEALVVIFEAMFGDPDEVRMASTELD